MTIRFWPLEKGCTVTSPFGPRAGGFHYGIDFGWPGGSAGRGVYAVQAGTVIKAGAAQGYGGPDPAGWLVIDSTDEQGAGCFEYGHIVREVGVGQVVAAGQRIGYVNPNSSTNGGVAPHCHVSFWPRAYGGPEGKQDWKDKLVDARFPGDPAPGPGPAPSGPVFGIDVSNHQGNFDFAGARGEGFAFATHKVTEGADYVDPYWARARTEMVQHFPGRCGGYVFCRTAVAPAREADALEAAFGSKADMLLQIDYEDDRRVPQGAADLRARVAEYQRRGFRLLPIYLPRWYWQRMGSPDLSFLADVGIWNSSYSSADGYASAIYAGFNSAPGWADMGGAPVRILQFTDKALVTKQRIDANAVKDSAALARIFNTEEDDMAFTDEDRAMLRYVYEQLGPKLPSWDNRASMGKTPDGKELTVRDGLAAMKRTVEGGK